MSAIIDDKLAVDTSRLGWGRAFRIISSCELSSRNPYWQLFYSALSNHGAECIGAESFGMRWLSRNIGRFDAYHFHYVEDLGRFPHPVLWRLLPLPFRWRKRVGSGVFGLVDLVRLRLFLRKCRSRGIRLIWTLHNIESHEGSSAIEQMGHRLLARYCDLIICHSESARQECIRLYRPSYSSIVMPIGNYNGVFPQPTPREHVLRDLGLDPQVPVVSCVGQVRDYKGVDVACDAAAKLAGRVQLVVAGDMHPQFDANRLRHRIAAIAGARLLDRHLSDLEYASIINASQAVLLPYRKITGSSAIFAAITLGSGVIAADLPFFREVLVGHDTAGALFTPGDPEDLAATIINYLAIPTVDREHGVRELAEKHDWSKAILPVVSIIDKWRSN